MFVHPLEAPSNFFLNIRDFEKKLTSVKSEMSKVNEARIREMEKRASLKREEALQHQDKVFQNQMAAILKELHQKHSQEIQEERREIALREAYISKLLDAVAFLQNSMSQLTKETTKVHEKMKYFIDETFDKEVAQFLVPRLDLSEYLVEPDISRPVLSPSDKL